jgi:hypothetical protein
VEIKYQLPSNSCPITANPYSNVDSSSGDSPHSKKFFFCLKTVKYFDEYSEGKTKDNTINHDDKWLKTT